MPPRRAPTRGAAAANRGATDTTDAAEPEIKVEKGAKPAPEPELEVQIKPEPISPRAEKTQPAMPQAPMGGNAPVADMTGGSPAPAATPAERPPVQRLASLRGRGATRGVRGARGGAGGASTAASGSSTPAAEGSPAPGTPKPVVKARFRPKAVTRKTAEQREALAAEEEARLAADEKAANRGTPRGRGRGRGRGGRGRGDTRMTENGERIITGGATGIFSQLAPSMKKGGNNSRPGGGGGAFAGSSSIVRSSGGGGGGGRSGGDSTGRTSEPVYPEELEDPDDVMPRLDIEHINLSDDDDDVVFTGKRKVKGGNAMKPIRLERHEHHVRPTVVNVEAKKEDVIKKADEAEGSLFVEQDVKADDEMDLDAIPHRGSIDLDEPIPPKDRRESIDFDAAVPEARRKKPSKVAAKKDKKPVLQTQEDIAEYEIKVNDTAEISHQLATLQASTTAQNGDVEMGEDGQPKESDHKEGRLYLFQLPPILPKLRKESETEEVKADEDDVVMTDIPSTSTPIDLTTTTDSKIKTESALEEDAPAPPKPAPVALVNETGQIGKLVVRKSGKVEFSWGGTSLALSNGAKNNFLTKGVIVHGVKEGKKEEKEEESVMKGTGMGRVWGKFVATPDWEKLF